MCAGSGDPKVGNGALNKSMLIIGGYALGYEFLHVFSSCYLCHASTLFDWAGGLGRAPHPQLWRLSHQVTGYNGEIQKAKSHNKSHNKSHTKSH